MNHTLKWKVGHKFWVARCRKECTEIQKIDEYGIVWKRMHFQLKASAKQKIITRITIDEIGIIYEGTDAKKDGVWLSQTFKETEIDKFKTEEEALSFAKHYEMLNEEYLGDFIL